MTPSQSGIRTIICVSSLAILAVLPAPGHADDVALGVEAYGNGAYRQAHDILRPLAKAGNAEAQYHLGVMRRDGLGTPANVRVAAHWFRLAARQGNPHAVIALDTLLEKQWPAPPAYAAVARWLHRQAKDGDPHAQLHLGCLYRDTQLGQFYGIPWDLAEAAGWFTLAAEQGLAEAQVNLGRLYDKRARHSSYAFGGASVEEVEFGPAEDLVAAYKWYSLAAAHGHPEAENLRDAVETHLSPEDLVHAIELIREANLQTGA